MAVSRVSEAQCAATGKNPEGDRVKHIDVYFGASYRNGRFVKQAS